MRMTSVPPKVYYVNDSTRFSTYRVEATSTNKEYDMDCMCNGPN